MTWDRASQFVGVFGRPPFFPFRRAAAALARLERPLLASPPKRPSATAAGVLRFDMGIHGLHVIEPCEAAGSGLAAGDVLVAAVKHRQWLAADQPQALNGVGHWRFAGREEAARGGVCRHG